MTTNTRSRIISMVGPVIVAAVVAAGLVAVAPQAGSDDIVVAGDRVLRDAVLIPGP